MAPNAEAVKSANEGLLVRRIVRAALPAVNIEVMDLIFFRVQQDCAAVAADIIKRVIAGLEYGRGADNRPNCRRSNNLEWHHTIFAHHAPLNTGGSAVALSHRRPAYARAGDVPTVRSKGLESRVK
jgi:hypothetical protein